MRRVHVAGAFALAALLGAFAQCAQATALGPDELARVCADADGLVHCGRLVEQVQMQRLPNLARREGDSLFVRLYPSGETSFVDTSSPGAGRSYALWDFLDVVNAVVVYSTQGDEASFVILQRDTGRRTELPAEPHLAPDRQRLATADFCAEHCTNEIAVWKLSRDGVRKEASWTLGERWTDATVRWKSPDVLVIEYSRGGDGPPRTLERRLDARDWRRPTQP